jgi:hypothetical protein
MLVMAYDNPIHATLTQLSLHFHSYPPLSIQRYMTQTSARPWKPSSMIFRRIELDTHFVTPDINVISDKWLFKNKLNPDGTLERHKGLWVICGFKQRWGIDFKQTFSPIVKPGTIHTMLHLAASHNWPINQLNIKNVFLHGELAEHVYCLQPVGFIDDTHPDHVCLLSKSL